jgi:hypothetical protein
LYYFVNFAAVIGTDDNMQKWEYGRINSGKTITENWRRDTRDMNFIIPGKMEVWVVV